MAKNEILQENETNFIETEISGLIVGRGVTIANDINAPINERLPFRVSAVRSLPLEVVRCFFPGALGLKFLSDDKQWQQVRVEMIDLLCFSTVNNTWYKEVYIPTYNGNI